MKLKHLLFGLAITSIFISALIVGGCSTEKQVSKPMLKSPPIIDAFEVTREHILFNRFENGILYKEAGQYDKALQSLNLALESDPHSIEINYELASLYLQMRQPEEAFKLRENVSEPNAEFSLLMGKIAAYLGDDSTAQYYFRKTIEKDPVNYTALYYLSTYYMRNSMPDSALTLLKKMVEIKPYDYDAQSNLGIAYIAKGEYDSASVAFRNALKDNPYHKAATIGLSNIYEHKGEIKKALKLYDKYLSRHPEDLTVQYRKLDDEISLKLYDEAIKTGNLILKSNPDDKKVILSLAQIYFAQNNWDEAGKLLGSYLNSSPEDYRVATLLGRLYMYSDRFAKADSIFRKIIATDDTLSDGYVMLASNFVRHDQPDSAIAVLKRGIPKVSNPDFLYNQIGNVYSLIKDYDKAADYFRKAYERNPAEPSHRIALAEALDNGGHFEEAEKVLVELIKETPDNATALNNLAYMYVNRGIKYKKAEKLLKRALKLEPKNGAFLDSYGWLLFKRGKIKKALSYIRQALDNLGNDAEVYEHLGDIYLQMKDYAKASDSYRKALNLDPQNKRIQEKLNSLP